MDKDPELLNTFRSIGTCCASNDVVEKEIEKFVDVNIAHYNIFRLGKYCKRDMPCTKDILRKHLNRVTYQAAIWKRALNPIVNTPNIAEHGWLVHSNGNVSIDWMDSAPAPDGILENVQCAYKTGCTSNRCSCRKANLQCTSVCQCNHCSNGALENEDEDESDNDDTTDMDQNDGEYGDECSAYSK